MEELLNKRIHVMLFDSSDLQIGEAVVLVENDYTILETKSRLDFSVLNTLIAVFNNGHHLILISGLHISSGSSSFQSEHRYRFHESIYFPNNEADLFTGVKCRILVLHNWFQRKYYSLTEGESETALTIENEKLFTIEYEDFKIGLYYSAVLNLYRTVIVQPKTYLIVENSKCLKRFELSQMLNYVVSFYQCFFSKRFDSNNLTFMNEQAHVYSHFNSLPVYQRSQIL